MSSQERMQADAAHFAKDFLAVVRDAISERLRELKDQKELPAGEELWDMLLELPTKRVQVAEAVAGIFHEPLLDAILNEHMAYVAAKEEDVSLAARWVSHQRVAKIDRLVAKAAYELILVELDEKVRIEQEEAELALSGSWNIHAMRAAFEHEYELDRFLVHKQELITRFKRGHAASSRAVYDLDQQIKDSVRERSPLDLFFGVCQNRLRSDNSRAVYWTIYMILGAFSKLPAAHDQLPALATELLQEYRRKLPTNLHNAYLSLIQITAKMQMPHTEWHDPVPALYGLSTQDFSRRHTAFSSCSDPQARSADRQRRCQPRGRRNSSGNEPAWGDWELNSAWRSRSYSPPQMSPRAGASHA